MAGLPASRALVCVGPPLFCSGPSSGSWPKMLAVFVPFRTLPAPMVGVVWIRLLVALIVLLLVPVKRLMSLAPVRSLLPETMVLTRLSVAVPDPSPLILTQMPPPLLLAAVLLLIVEFSID